ncbi:hypothetical protein CRYUN_Cryun02cG0208100 [Craigia yunnanensis]
MENGSVEIYSQNAEWNTGKFPDVVAAISRFKKSSVNSFVLDCELVDYDRVQKKILPFQILSTRAQKNVVVSDIKVDVRIFAFDILYLNKQPLLQEQLKVRKEDLLSACITTRLYDSFEEEAGFFQFATALTSNDLEEIQAFLNSAVSSSCEGLIIRTLDRDATYEPSKRSLNWLKLKKDYMESIGDTLDLVPYCCFPWPWEADCNEEFQIICKIGTGFTEAELEERSARLRSKVIPEPKVWEVKAADLTISPVHRAAIGIVDPDKGISLRFPSLVHVREDKAPEQASSSEQAEMYNAQKHNQTNNEDDGEDD